MMSATFPDTPLSAHNLVYLRSKFASYNLWQGLPKSPSFETLAHMVKNFPIGPFISSESFKPVISRCSNLGQARLFIPILTSCMEAPNWDETSRRLLTVDCCVWLREIGGGLTGNSGNENSSRHCRCLLLLATSPTSGRFIGTVLRTTLLCSIVKIFGHFAWDWEWMDNKE